MERMSFFCTAVILAEYWLLLVKYRIFKKNTPATSRISEWLIDKGMQTTIDQMMERHSEAHKGNWQEFMKQSAEDWRLYPQLTTEQLGSIQCLCLFISGEHDPFVDEERVKYLSSLVKGSKYLVVSGGSHRPHMTRENPTLVNDSILQLLEQSRDDLKEAR